MSSDDMQTECEEKNRSSGDEGDLEPGLPVFPSSSKPCVNVWMDKMSKGILNPTHFKEHWRIWVPKIYSPEPNGNCLDWSFDEEEAQKMLYNTLEEFICNGEPREVLKGLRQMDSPPSVCGRVFRMGEPTYFCRECGMDPTCVLCVNCFKESVHPNHKYKMGTSSGGGCCDCGDAEAWKKEAFCKTHLAGAMTSRDSNGKKLPEDMASRASATFVAVLKYCYDLLTLEHSPGLPSDLQIKETDEDPLSLLGSSSAATDAYCTVLYNDETHTFEQVISTLTKVIKCSQKDAIEFVTNIDRDGRAVVKCSDFQHCNELKSAVERFTWRHSNRPLKVLVVHAHVVAHQIFAMKLLAWLQSFISLSEGFRVIFSDVALNTKAASEVSIVAGILTRDFQLWKSARTAWHRLFISGMVMEYESKKALAIVFTYNYGPVMKDFIRDDHDHSFSVTSLSIQLYTVPTLAHHLIAHHDVLFILLNTFISESSRRCNSSGKLEFERNTPNTSFKRAQYILYDLCYLLTTRPTVWTDDLRRGFLQGVSLLLTLLCSMQWMDAVLRQVGQHMEYEPEWESAFNLHIKLSPVISLALEWCGSDRIALVKAFRLVLRKLSEQPGNDQIPGQLREIADHSATCLAYDVAAEPVSIHLPLSRFLAGLFLHLERHDLHFQSNEFTMKNRPSPEQIIEPVLRAQAMISQVHAGMWRRNGYSLLNQLYFYHNVRCRTEMLDRDIILLQVGASLIESNEFLIHVLNKFNLTAWADRDFEGNSLKNPEEDSTRQTINLVEEFLGLLITIVGERHSPGVGQVTADDRLKKEIIQQLCIKPLSHSELNKTLPDGIHHETGLERVINDVATFKKSCQTSAGKRVYELKEEFYEEYNVFFYHYTKEELSRSEEAQRKRRKSLGLLECCPPPKLPRLTESFAIVANLLQCDVMLHIMQTVLERALNLRARTFSEPQVHKILHLIGYALQEEESGFYPFFIFTERAEKSRMYKLLEELVGSPRIDAHKDLLHWTMEKYRQVAGSRLATGMDSGNSGTETGSEAPSGETTASGESGTTRDATSAAKNGKEWRMKMAAQKRDKVMAQMAAMQNHFIKKNTKLFEEAGAFDQVKSSDRGSSMDLTESEQVPVAVGPRQTARSTEERTHTCILCQEDEAVTASGKAMVLAAFVQQSTVLCQTRDDASEWNHWFLSSRLDASPHISTCGHVMHVDCWQRYFDNVVTKETRRPYRLRQPASFDVEKEEYLCPLCECLSNTVLPLLPALATIKPSDSVTGATTDQAQILDFDNWLRAMSIIADQATETSSTGRTTHSRDGNSPEQTPRHSHQDNCRYCCATGQTADPDVISEDKKVQSSPLAASMPTMPSPYCRRMAEPATQEVTPEKSKSRCPIRAVYDAMGAQVGEALERLYDHHDPDLSEPLISVIHVFAQGTYIKSQGPESLRDIGERIPQLAWKSTAYTIHSIEFLLRDNEKPLLGSLSSRQRDCLECLARISAVLGSTWSTYNADDLVLLNDDATAILAIVLGKASTECFTDFDPFGLLITLTATLPCLLNTVGGFPTSIIIGGRRELYALKIVFVLLIAKILATSDFTESDAMEVDAPEDDPDVDHRENPDCSSLLVLMKAMELSTGGVADTEIWRRIKIATLPFLRCCALYYHYVTDVGAPEALTIKDGDTYENICEYLGLPTNCADLRLDDALILDVARGWMQHPRSRSSKVVREPLKVNKLVDLPEDYSELINTVSLFTCPNSDREDSRNPTMCLVCGEMLCSQSYCCQTELNKIMVGACTSHASKCGTGVGIFLRVRECEILFLRSPNRGSFVCPPYLDEYGETDQGLRRGNPLKLSVERYKQLNQMWLSHGLHEAIARAIEASSNHMSTQWHHL